MLAGEIGLTQNGVSVYYAFKNAQDPKIAALAADVDHASMPIGPVGRGTETALVVNSMIFKHSKYPNAAKAYLTFLMEEEQYDKWLTGSAGYWAQPLAGLRAEQRMDQRSEDRRLSRHHEELAVVRLQGSDRRGVRRRGRRLCHRRHVLRGLLRLRNAGRRGRDRRQPRRTLLQEELIPHAGGPDSRVRPAAQPAS